MTQFVFVYLGGNQPSSPEEASKHFNKYIEWLSSLGDAVISPTIPLFWDIQGHLEKFTLEGEKR